MLTALVSALVLMSVAFIIVFVQFMAKRFERPSAEAAMIGAVTNFFDTLGIGSMAPTTAYIKFRKMTPDELIPPTMIVGYALAVAVQALVFMTAIKIDPVLLVASIAAAVAGALTGAVLVAYLPVRAIRAAMGAGLLIAAIVFALSNLGMMPAGGTATSLPPGLFATVLVVNFILGGLMNVGIGNYAPSLIILSLMGLDPRAAFPIMMGSSAFLMLSSGFALFRTRPMSPAIISGMVIGAVPAVLVAALVVHSLPLGMIRWGVVVVALYTSVVMLRAALTNRAVSTV